MIRRPAYGILVGVITFAIALGFAFCSARLKAQEHAATVPVAVLEKLLPAPAGWTKIGAKSDQVVVSAECSDPVASVVSTQGEKRVKSTVADSGGIPGRLVCA